MKQGKVEVAAIQGNVLYPAAQSHILSLAALIIPITSGCPYSCACFKHKWMFLFLHIIQPQGDVLVPARNSIIRGCPYSCSPLPNSVDSLLSKFAAHSCRPLTLSRTRARAPSGPCLKPPSTRPTATETFPHVSANFCFAAHSFGPLTLSQTRAKASLGPCLTPSARPTATEALPHVFANFRFAAHSFGPLTLSWTRAKASSGPCPTPSARPTATGAQSCLTMRARPLPLIW